MRNWYLGRAACFIGALITNGGPFELARNTFKQSPAWNEQWLNTIFQEILYGRYSNDFAIVTKEHFELDLKQIEAFKNIHDTEIKTKITHADIIQEGIYTITKLENLEILSATE